MLRMLKGRLDEAGKEWVNHIVGAHDDLVEVVDPLTGR